MVLGGAKPCGSGRARLDPLALPVRFTANDAGADGRQRQVELDRDRFKNAPEMTQLMREYQDAIRNERPNGMYEAVLPPERAGQSFVGVDQCKGCHTQAFEVWKNSRHAHALESLTKGRADEPKEYVVDRSFDPECLACHSTGWNPQRAERFKSGFVDLKTTPQLVK